MRNGKRILCLLLALLTALSLSACRKTPKLPTFEDFPDSYTEALPDRAQDGLTLHAFPGANPGQGQHFFHSLHL